MIVFSNVSFGKKSYGQSCKKLNVTQELLNMKDCLRNTAFANAWCTNDSYFDLRKRGLFSSDAPNPGARTHRCQLGFFRSTQLGP